MVHTAQHWLDCIRDLPLAGPVRILNVCGGHERTISTAGMRSALPSQVELIPGPGCPVCVCPEQDIYTAIQLALNEDLVLVSFGDMLRVPVNTPKGSARTLEQARAMGADVRPVASPREAVAIAHETDRPVVFFAAGFETTTAPVAAMLAEGVPDNLFVLLSARLTWPAVAMLMHNDKVNVDAVVAPGHVATVMGSQQWQFLVEQYALPVAVAGFTTESLLAAFYSVLRQALDDKPFLDNSYPEVVTDQGNTLAQDCLNTVMDVVDADWRGIGTIPASGFALNENYAAHDARLQLPDYSHVARKRIGEMPPGCDCSNVVLGIKQPDQCKLYGTGCTPREPVGPCMVSDEGACRIWWQSGIRKQKVAV